MHTYPLHPGVALGGAFVLGVLSHWPAVADTYVDGASYGDEKRFLLRAPGPVVLALGPLAWALTVAGVVVGPLLLASGDSAVGSAACVAGLPIAAASARALHHLHRRWIVLVPAGFVLHDHLALADPTLLPRDALTSVGPASADTDAHDLTQAARGMALEVRCREPHDLRPASRDGSAEVVVTEAILCAPARPDAVLAEAKRRRLPTA